MTWKERLIGIPLAVLGAVLLVATAAGMTLTRTGWGREQVRAFALEKLNAAIRGRVEIDAVLEGDVLRMVRLAGVRIYEPDGVEFARVDTLTVRYRWADFLIGNVTIQQVELVGPVARVRKLLEGGFNFEEIFRSPNESTGVKKEGRGRRIVLRDVTIRSGDVSLFLSSYPDDPRLRDSRWHIEEHKGVPGRAFRLERLSAELPIARVAAPEGAGRLFRIAQLSALATVVGPPFEVEQLRADLELHGDTLSFDLWEADLADSRLFGEGRVTLSGKLTYDVTLSGNPLTTPDVNWLLPWLPEGVAHLDLQFESVPGGIALAGRNARWASPDARLSGRFGLRFDDGPGGVEFDDVSLDIERLTSGLIGSLSGWDPPTSGEVSGRVELDGRFGALRVDTDLRLVPIGASRSSRLQARGVALAMPDSLGAEDLTVVFDTLQLELLRAFVPQLAVTGEVSGNARLDGTLIGGLGVRFDLVQRDRTFVPTSLSGEGRIWADGVAPPRFDMTVEARRVSLTTLAHYYPAIPFRGEFTGGLRAVGPLDNLNVDARLLGTGDSLRVRGAVRAAKGEVPAYEAEIRGWRVRLPQFRPDLPQSDVDFAMAIEGRGVKPAEAESRGRARLFASFVGGVQFDSAQVDFRLANGRLQVDSATAVGEFGEVRAEGALAVSAGQGDSLRFDLRADSLGAFNAWLAPGYGLMAPQRLVANGAVAAGDEAGARLEGRATARGWAIQEADGIKLRGSLEGQRLAYGRWSADSLRVGSLSVGRQGELLTARAELAGTGVGIGELRFTDLELAGMLAERRADLNFVISKPGAEARGTMWIGAGENARTIGLDSLTLRLGGSDWQLIEPAELQLGESGAVAVQGFELASGSRRMGLEGSVGVAGPAAFTARITGVDLADLANLWPDSLAVGGRLELNAELSGLVRDPVITGRFEVIDGRLFGVSYTNLAGTLDYGDGRLAMDASMWHGDDQLFRVHGTLPLDLTLPSFGLSIPERPIDLRLDGDSIPLALVTLFTDQIEDVRGHARAALVMRGTPHNVDMQGPVGLRDGGFRFIWSGIDYRRMEGQMTFDGAVMRVANVGLRGAQGGRGTISGTVDFRELANPTFALQLDAVELPAYDQIDARVVGSGRIELTGRFDQPEISGDLTVVHGVLYLEELERRSAIVDPFEDPFLLIDQDFLAETTGGRSRSPFMQNLTIQLGLKVERDTWLRSSEANVQITGNLNVQMQPAQNELWIDGTLQAVRGDYRFANKRFEVMEGTIEFVGTPPMNPNLRITARYTVRTQKQPIDIRLVIGGTLEDMTLTLESDAQPPIPESDLLSYLVFGRPSYELTRPGDEGSIIGDFTRGVPEALVGYALGSLLVGEAGIAYVDVSRVDPVGEDSEFRRPLGPALSATQVELGWYLAPTVFVSFAQQLVGVPPTATVEWRLDERFTLRAITQPRRGQESFLFSDAALTDLEQSFGLFLFYGWAY